MHLSKSDLATISANLFPDSDFNSTLQRHRWRVCPFDRILATLPDKNCDVFDIGCGSGLFIGFLKHYRYVECATGIDSNKYSVERAREVIKKAGWNHSVELIVEREPEQWPNRTFDLVSMIDVLHHIRPALQEVFFTAAVDRLAQGGTMVVKEIVPLPNPWALANLAHDLLLARQLVRHVSYQQLLRWAAKLSLRVNAVTEQRTLWYNHYWMTFSK